MEQLPNNMHKADLIKAQEKLQGLLINLKTQRLRNVS